MAGFAFNPNTPSGIDDLNANSTVDPRMFGEFSNKNQETTTVSGIAVGNALEGNLPVDDPSANLDLSSQTRISILPFQLAMKTIRF